LIWVVRPQKSWPNFEEEDEALARICFATEDAPMKRSECPAAKSEIINLKEGTGIAVSAK